MPSSGLGGFTSKKRETHPEMTAGSSVLNAPRHGGGTLCNDKLCVGPPQELLRVKATHFGNELPSTETGCRAVPNQLLLGRFKRADSEIRLRLP